MDIGVDICVTANAAKVAQRAEELGFSAMWFADTPAVAGDLFVGMGAAAAVTKRIRIGSGVCVPWTRNPVVTAGGFSTVNALAPGRVDLVFGTGFSARRCFGLKAMKIQDFSTHVRAVMGLLRGEEVEVEVEGAMRGVKLMHPHTVNLKDPIKIHIAASGPKMKALVAELGVGSVDLPSMFASDDSDTFSDMRRIWRDAERPAEDLHLWLTMSAIVLRGDENVDSKRVREIGGPMAMATVHYWADEVMLHGKQLPETLPPSVYTAVDAYIALIKSKTEPGAAYLKLHEGHGLFLRSDEAHILNRDLMERGCFVGTPDQLRERMHSLERSGAELVVFSVMPGHEDAMDDIAKALELKPPKTYSNAKIT
jgi:5,10-methylenetetrahydromethanopterin reductase